MVLNCTATLIDSLTQIKVRKTLIVLNISKVKTQISLLKLIVVNAECSSL